MAKTKIEWTAYTWNPITGCRPISDGCVHCYAKRMATRLAGRCGYPAEQPFQPGIVHEKTLQQPDFPKKPTHIFVCSMGDLFHEVVTDDLIQRVFAVMQHYPQHTFQLLTKRSKRLLRFAQTLDQWPTNVWVGVTVEHSNSLCLDRLFKLAQIPAPVRFVSVEPMIGAVELTPLLPSLDWVICGAETGPQARPCDLNWVRSLRDQCIEYRIPFFFKKDSIGQHTLDGLAWEQMPMPVHRSW